MKLISYIIEISNIVDKKRTYELKFLYILFIFLLFIISYPNIANRIFQTENVHINNAIFSFKIEKSQNNEILSYFFSFLDKKSEKINETLAGYFKTAFNSLVSTNYEEVILFEL